MNIILVSLRNFQEYILDNIRQLIRLGHKDIYVITDHPDRFGGADIADNIRVLCVSDGLDDEYGYMLKTSLNDEFRDGFWTLTSLRLFYLYAAMKKYDIQNVIHLENDVPIYYHVDTLSSSLDNTKIYMPFDSYERSILSIVYIPNHAIWKQVLDRYNYRLNDMQNFSKIGKETGLIEKFPIFDPAYPGLSEEQKWVSRNFDAFGVVFDAAAIGQYLGGVDPRNICGDTTGFVNETCVIKYDNFNILWKVSSDIRRPFIQLGEKEVPIFNLHIHCKNVRKFVS